MKTKRVRFWWPKEWRKIGPHSMVFRTKKSAEWFWGKGNVVQLEIREVGDDKAKG